MSEGTRSLKIRCATWEQVEAFYSTKLKNGRWLAIRVPFNPPPGTALTLALGLPNQLVMAIDGTISKVAPAPDGKRAQVLIDLHGMTEAVVGRLRTLVEDAGSGHAIAQPPPAQALVDELPASDEPVVPAASPTDAPVDELVEQPPQPAVDQVEPDEREVFLGLEQILRKLREAAAHEVLGVPWDPSVEQLRAGYFQLTKVYHPDVYAKYRSAAVVHLASEVFIHINKAYDRMRDAVAAAGAGVIAGPALLPHNGWIAGFEDVEDAEPVRKPAPAPKPTRAPARSARAKPVAKTPVEVTFASRAPAAPAPPAAPLTEDSLFGDIDPESERGQAAGGTAEESSVVAQLMASGAASQQERDLVRAMESEAHQLLAEGANEVARERLAAALQLDPRNRPLRALYHVANGHVLLERGQRAEALAQFEIALRHNPECQPAQVAIASTPAYGVGGRRAGILGKLFKG